MAKRFPGKDLKNSRRLTIEAQVVPGKMPAIGERRNFKNADPTIAFSSASRNYVYFCVLCVCVQVDYRLAEILARDENYYRELP